MATKKQAEHISRSQLSLDDIDRAGIRYISAPPKPDQVTPEAEGTGFLRTQGDRALSLGQGVVGGVKMLSDLAGADNPVSQTLGGVNAGMADLYSPARKEEMRVRQDAIDKADAGGSTADQITSRLGGIADAPLQTILQAAGSMAPNIAAALATGGSSTLVTFGRILQGALGVGMGVGSVKGQNYQAVLNEATKQGLPADEAKALAVAASEYSANNAPQQALGGALGALDSLTGAERIVSNMARRGAGQEVGKDAAQGWVRRGVSGGGAEAAPEGLQGSQGQYAQNQALNNAGFSTDPWAGVAGQGVNDAVVGAMVGGPLGVTQGNAPAVAPQPTPADQIRATKMPETGTLTKGINAGIEAQASVLEEGASAGRQPFDRFSFGTRERAATFAAGYNDSWVPAQKADGTWSFVEGQPLATESAGAPAQPGQAEADVAGRVAELKTDLLKPETMTMLREKFGSDGTQDLLHVIGAVESGQLPARTSLKMLEGAERRLAALRMSVIPSEQAPDAAPALAAPEAQQQLGMEPAAPAIAYDQAPTGTMRVDAAGNAVPETEADAINTRQAQAEQVDLGQQARRASAVFGEPGPAQESAAPATPALTYDTAPTGTMIVDDAGGVRAETRAEVIDRQQEQQQRRDTGLTPDVERASMRAATGTLTQPGDILTSAGFPFRNRKAATAAAARAGAGFAPVEISPDSFVVRQTPTDINEQDTPAGPGSTPAAEGAQQASPDQGGSLPAGEGSGPAAAAGPAAVSADGLTQPNEIRTASGQPFKSKAPAARAAKLNPGYALAEVEGGWVLRKENGNAGTDDQGSRTAGPADVSAGDAAGGMVAEQDGRAAAPGAGTGAEVGAVPDGAVGGTADAVKRVTGKAIDKEWTAFSAESGTLNIPRAKMPQIKAEHRGAMVNFLAARGITHESGEVPASELKPTQAEFSSAKVDGAKAFTGGDRSILVSSDGHVLDGHHQWLAKLDGADPVKIIRLDSPITTLLEEVKEFPSAEVAQGTPAVEPAAEPVATSGATARPRTTASAAPVPSERQAPAAPGAKIDDFGEKLVGARKDYAATLGDAMAVDVAAEPLSKSWPEPDYEKLLAGGTDPFAVAWVHAARDEIPVKPVKSWRLTGWVDNVKLLRDIAQQLLDGRLSAEAVRTKMKDPAYRNVAAAVGGRVELYEAVGHGKSLKGVSFAEHHYSLYRGESNVHKWVVEQKARATAFSNWPRTIAEGNTKVEALALFKDRIASLDLGEKAKKQPQFVIYRKRGVPGAFIGKKIGREHIDLKKLDDVDAARKYLETGAAQLEAALAKYKETPLERNAANQPRVGDDHRNGAPVTPEVFAETFGFRGVQFGNYVEQGRRQSDLNQTFDALMDLAAVLGIPARSLSLNGRLGLAFGARGKGGVNAPAAHFEPGNVVINLTKGGGPGSLAHEWWHALDNYFARQGGDGGGFVTGGAKTDLLREQMKRAFDVVRRATQIGALRKRSAELDKRRSKPYWDTPIELSARSFESYVIAKLQDQSAANDYLANVVSPDSWGAIESLRAGALGEPVAPSYPYPLADEMPGLRAGFDEFFQAVEARASDDGNVALLSRGEGGGVDASELRKTLEPLTKSWAAGPAGGVHVVQSVDDLPARLSEGIKSVGAEETVRAMFVPSSSTVYLVADNLTSIEEAQTALFHEVYGHLGLRAFLGDQYADVMGRMRDANRKLAGEAVMWFLANGQDEIDVRVQRGMTKEAARRQVQLLAVEEALADRAGRNEPISSWRFLAAQLQKALRAIGLDKVADWMEDKTQAEVMDLLRQARDAVKRRPPGMAQAARGAGELAMSRDDTPALSRKPSEAIADLTPQLVKDMLAGRGFKRVSWWHKSVGTMFDMAQKHPAFKKVFDGAQAYIQDTSFFANDAADQAPQVLPQLNGFGDFKKALSLPDADRKAIAVPIFEGTLNWTRDAKGALVETDDVASAGVVFTPEELASRFKLNDHQIGLYREFRAAVDRSLESTMAGDLIRYLGDHAPAGARDLARAGEFKALRAAVLAKVDTLPAGKLQDEIRAEVNDKLERLDSLKARGYAPLMRFGKFAVRVIGAGGESKFFGLYESGADAAKAARLLSEDPQFKNDEITRGVMSQEDFKLLKGLSPETLGLFASITGTDKNEAMQLWLKQATSNRSALKRMIKRKGVEGYSEDVSRVLSGFITSNARGASQGLHFGEMQQNVSDIREGDIKDAAERLRNYVQNPVEEAAGLRGFLFVNFLGGSIASAAVNMTQPFLMTMPYLSKFVGIPGAARVMGASLKQMTAGVDGDMKTALEIAEKDGIVSPQELHQLQAMAMGRGSLLGQAARFAGANDQISATLDAAGKRAMFIWGAPFALAEQFNRRLTFIAAYQVAKEKHHIDPYAFAAQAVTETQGLYNKANRPEWARGAIGATLFTFKQYSISYLEFMKRMWTAGEPGSIERAEGRKAALFGLALLVMAAGAQGLPGADDLDDLIDTIGQKMGEDTNSKAWKQKNLPAWLQYGFSALPGIPLDVAGRLGIGNLLPGTGLLRKDKADKSGDVLEVFGAVGGVAKNAMLAADSGSLIPMLPTAIANAMKAVDIAKTGAYRDTKGRRVIDADLGDAAIKGIGFQPATVAAASRADGLTIAHNTLARNTEASIASEWAAARFEGDAEGEKGARARLKQWNDTNPDTPIAISMPQIIKRVQQMRSTRAERIVKSTPKELRQPAKAG